MSIRVTTDTDVTGDSPRLSVVIPSYGRPDILDECISALLEQTYDDLEVIVVHDGPGRPDYDTPVVEVIHRDDPKGSPAAKNRGIDAATGDIVVFIDDDSIPASVDWASEYADAFSRCDDDVGAIGGYIEEQHPFPSSEGTGAINRTRLGFYRIVSGFDADTTQEVDHLKSCNFAVRAPVFGELEKPYFDPQFKGNAHREETDFTLRIRQAGYRLLYTPTCRVTHKHAQSGGQRASVSGNAESAYWSGRNESLLYYKHFHEGLISLLVFILQESIHNRLLPWYHFFKICGVLWGLILHRYHI